MPIVPVTFNFDASVTEQQRAWIQSARDHSRFPFGNGQMTITFHTVPEPPCAGHNDYMCTTVAGTEIDVYIRDGADSPSAPFNTAFNGNVAEVRRFFEESIIHEVVGHAFPFSFMALDDVSKARLAGWFRYHDAGGDNRRGTLADWNPLDKVWGDRIQEALAEFLKDTFMPDAFREYENRTNWDFQQENFGDLIDWIQQTTCPSAAGPAS